LADQRKHIINEEQRKFMEAKKEGIKALINYKLTKQKFRKNLTALELKFKDQFQEYTSKVEEAVAYNKLKRMEELKVRNVGYMYTRNTSTKQTKIIAAGVNVENSKYNIDLLTKATNLLNKMNSIVDTKDLDNKKKYNRLEPLVEQYQEIMKLKYGQGVNTNDMDFIITTPTLTDKERKNIIQYQLSLLRVEMKHWKFQKGYNMNKLFDA
jgi:hypothetical protein